MRNSKIIDYYVCRRFHTESTYSVNIINNLRIYKYICITTFFLELPKPLPVTVAQSKSKEIKKFSMQTLNYIFGCNYMLFASIKYTQIRHATCCMLVK